MLSVQKSECETRADSQFVMCRNEMMRNVDVNVNGQMVKWSNGQMVTWSFKQCCYSYDDDINHFQFMSSHMGL